MKIIRTAILQLSAIGLAIALLMIWMLMTSGEEAEPIKISAVIEQNVTQKFIGEKAVSPTVEPLIKVAQPPVIGQPALTAPVRSELQKVSPFPETLYLGDGSLSHSQEMDVISRLFDLYIEYFGELPAGENNAQVMNALRGNNAQFLGLFPYEHARLDKQGQLLDPWNRPYFFHMLSRTEIEIRSAGPDQEMYTVDDVLRR